MASSQNNSIKASVACILTLIAVATVFMTQSIFPDISRSFAIEVGQARFAFSIASLFYSARES